MTSFLQNLHPRSRGMSLIVCASLFSTLQQNKVYVKDFTPSNERLREIATITKPLSRERRAFSFAPQRKGIILRGNRRDICRLSWPSWTVNRTEVDRKSFLRLAANNFSRLSAKLSPLWVNEGYVEPRWPIGEVEKPPRPAQVSGKVALLSSLALR